MTLYLVTENTKLWWLEGCVVERLANSVWSGKWKIWIWWSPKIEHFFNTKSVSKVLKFPNWKYFSTPIFFIKLPKIYQLKIFFSTQIFVNTHAWNGLKERAISEVPSSKCVLFWFFSIQLLKKNISWTVKWLFCINLMIQNMDWKWPPGPLHLALFQKFIQDKR